MKATERFGHALVIVWRLIGSDIAAYISGAYKKPVIILFTTLFVVISGFIYKATGEINSNAERLSQSIKPFEELALDLPHALRGRKIVDELGDVLEKLNEHSARRPLANMPGQPMGAAFAIEGVELASQLRSKALEFRDSLDRESFHSDSLSKVFQGIRKESEFLPNLAMEWQQIYEADLKGDRDKLIIIAISLRERYPQYVESFNRLKRQAEDAEKEAEMFNDNLQLGVQAFLGTQSYYQNLSRAVNYAFVYLVLYIICMTASAIWFGYKRNRRRNRLSGCRVTSVLLMKEAPPSSD